MAQEQLLLEIAEAFQRLKKQVTDLNVRSCFYMWQEKSTVY
jgi:hypothetical protein